MATLADRRRRAEKTAQSLLFPTARPSSAGENGSRTKPLRGGKDCDLARLPTASTAHAPPLRGPGSARPLPGAKALRRANFRLGHAGRQARTVSGCWNFAFSRHFLTIYGPSVQNLDTQLKALPTLPVLARTVFRLLELRVSRTGTKPLLRNRSLCTICKDSAGMNARGKTGKLEE